jgi:hypothetical protein
VVVMSSKSIWHSSDERPGDLCVGDCIAVIIGDPAYTLKTAWISEKGWVFPDGKPFDFVDCIRWAYMRDVVYQAIGNR